MGWALLVVSALLGAGKGSVGEEPQGYPLPVNADGTKIEDARSAHHDVQRDKDVTVDAAESPLADHLGKEAKEFRGKELEIKDWRDLPSQKSSQ